MDHAVTNLVFVPKINEEQEKMLMKQQLDEN